jgi:hypothetical protein
MGFTFESTSESSETVPQGGFQRMLVSQTELIRPPLTKAFPSSSVVTANDFVEPAALVLSSTQFPRTAIPGTGDVEIIVPEESSTIVSVATGNPPPDVPGCGGTVHPSKEQVTKMHKVNKVAYTILMVVPRPAGR